MKSLFAAFILAFQFSLSLSLAQPAEAAPGEFAATITADELEAQIQSKISAVPEFSFITEYAQKNGIRVWLFGGTAASFAHYAKWDLLRMKGDSRFQPDRFDYDYTNIYRSNQDLDIVLDAPADKVHALQSQLASKFPHLQGQKSAWEVRLLRESIGDKEAILGNPDFSNQHTDSHSVGMIELTRGSEPTIRDLRDWNNPRPAFLDDVVKARLHYYFSPLHGQTARAKKGLNPSIISVVRYYIKAFQFELAMDPKDEPALRDIVAKFDPTNLTDYERSWLTKNAPKLFQNAVNIEYAWNVLEKNGLRQKLLKIGSKQTMNSVAWWMSKEPLRTKQVGEGHGQTAEQRGITVVAHETNSFEAYESITRAHTGDPNVLISRENSVGEAAVFGDGFYTRIGREGARGTKITIRFTVDPNAREGTDFIKSDNYVIFLNKRALRVIPESLNWGLRDYIQFLAAGQIDANERAMLEKLKRRISARMALDSSKNDFKWFDGLIRDHIIEEGEGNAALLKAWFEYRRPFHTKVDPAFFHRVLLAAKESKILISVLANVEAPKRKYVLPFNVYLALLQEFRDLAAKSKEKVFFESEEPSTEALRLLGRRIQAKGYPGELVAQEWFKRAFNSDLATTEIVSVLPKIASEFHRLINDFERRGDAFKKHGPRDVSYPESLELMKIMPPFGSNDETKQKAFRRLFTPAEPTAKDLEYLNQVVEKWPKKYQSEGQGVLTEWLNRFGPLDPRIDQHLRNPNFNTAFISWFYRGDAKFDVTLEQAFHLLDRDFGYANGMDRRMRITFRKADRELLKAKFLDVDKLQSAALALLTHNLAEISLAPSEWIVALEKFMSRRFADGDPERKELFRALKEHISSLKELALEDYLKIVAINSKADVFHKGQRTDMEQIVKLDGAAIRSLDLRVKVDNPNADVERAEARLWMRAHANDLEARSKTLLALFARKETGMSHAKEFVVRHQGLPEWAESNYEFWKIFSFNTHEIIDAAIATDRYVNDTLKLKRLIELTHPSQQIRILQKVFVNHRSRDAELFLRAVERYQRYMGGSHDWEGDQAVESWKADARVRQVMRNNSIFKRKMTMENLKAAIALERTANLKAKPTIMKRVFGVRSCEGVFVR